MSDKLQLKANLTLEKAVKMVRQSEQIKEQVGQKARAEAGDATFLNEVEHTCNCNCRDVASLSEVGHNAHTAPLEQHGGRGRTQGGGSFHVARQRDGSAAESKCFMCGRNYRDNALCVARQARCRNCQKIGHFAAVCCFARVSELTTTERCNDDDISFSD